MLLFEKLLRTAEAGPTGNPLYVWGENTAGQIGDNTTVNYLYPKLIANTFKDVAFGDRHTIAIAGDNTLWAWGANESGQLGDASFITKSSPVQISSDSWSKIYAKGNFSMGIKNDGTMWMWGTKSNTSEAEDVEWKQMSANGTHIAGIKNNGTLWLWGVNSVGQLGDGTKIGRSSPVQVAGTWNYVSVGADHTLALNSSNVLYAWGNNTQGQLGNGTSISASSPVQVGNSSWALVSAGGSFSAAINYEGNLFMWGLNSQGQLASGNLTTLSNPTQIVSGTADWSYVGAGALFTAALKKDGTIWTWGDNASGQLGENQPPATDRSSPVQIAGGGTWTKLAVGYSNVLAVKSDGNLYGWGAGGLTGDGTNTSRSSPVLVNSGNVWTSIGAASDVSGGIMSDGTAWTWGINTFGILGTGTATTVNAPTKIAGTAPFDSSDYWVAYYAGAASIFKSKTGAIYIAGPSSYSADNFNLSIITRSFPTAVRSSGYSVPTLLRGNGFKRIFGYAGQSIGIRDDNSLWIWGAGNSPTGITQPVLTSNNDWTYAATGGGLGGANTNYAVIRQTGNLYIWGDNSTGQIGNSSNIFRSSPVQITGSWQKVEFTAGGTTNNHTAGIATDGNLFMWGQNTSGQLGNNSNVTLSSPVFVLSNCSNVSLGIGFTAAINNSGNLYVWGLNTSGQIGDTTKTARSIPTQITGSWSQVAVGGSHTLALRSDGNLWVWGGNGAGQLGLGNTISFSSPMQVAGTWKHIAAGPANSYGIKSDGTAWGWGAYGTDALLGTGEIAPTSTPSQILSGRNNFSYFVPGPYSVMLVDNENTVWMWGGGVNRAKMSPYRNTTQTSPFRYSISANSWNSVAIAKNHLLAIDSQYRGWGVGNNLDAQLGLEPTISGSVVRKTEILTPFNVTDLTTSWTQIASTDIVGYGIKNNNTLWAWGRNANFGMGANVEQWNEISISTSNGAAIRSDNTLWVWGASTNGMLGDYAYTISRSSPVQIPGSWSKISIGQDTSYGIKTDGNLFVWGRNGLGLLGLNSSTTTLTYSSPVQIDAGNTWIKVSTGPNHTHAIKSDKTLWSWGQGTNWQLGTNTNVNRSVPTLVTVGGVAVNDWIDVDAGDSFGLGIREVGIGTNRGNVFAWGDNAGGKLGINAPTTNTRSSPVQIAAGISDAILVSAGISHGALLTASSNIWTWGSSGALTGLNIGALVRSSPTQLPGAWKYVNCGFSNGAAIRSDGTAWTWGGNSFYQLGNASITSTSIVYSSPIQISSNSSWNKIIISKNIPNNSAMFGFGIDSSNILYSWGENGSGKLGYNPVSFPNATNFVVSSPIMVGLNSITNTDVPRQIDGSWSMISAGTSYTLATKTDGNIWGWGRNENNQLGIGNTTDQVAPVKANVSGSFTSTIATDKHSVAQRADGTLWAWGNTFSTYENVSQITAGNSAAAYINSSGQLWVWGLNTGGKLGTGFSETIPLYSYYSSPVQIPGSWEKIEFGNAHSLGINAGNVFAWGSNVSGRLGDDTSTTRSSPVLVLSGGNWKKIALYNNSAAIDSAGNLWIWGSNSQGQLGDLTSASTRSVPVQIATDRQWQTVAMGSNHTAAISNGNLFTWGSNSVGQLGNTTLTVGVNYSSPIQVGGTNEWADVACGNSSTYALKTDNTLWVWGLNTTGQLGIGNVINLSDPVLLPGTWSKISSKLNTVLASRSDGTIWAWGTGTLGQLGNNAAINQSSPVLVRGAVNPQSLSAGLPFSMTLNTANVVFMWGSFSTWIPFISPLITDDINITDRSNPVVLLSRPKSTPTQTSSDVWVNVNAGPVNVGGTQQAQ